METALMDQIKCDLNDKLGEQKMVAQEQNKNHRRHKMR